MTHPMFQQVRMNAGRPRFFVYNEAQEKHTGTMHELPDHCLWLHPLSNQIPNSSAAALRF
jgi:hypothetical protein